MGQSWLNDLLAAVMIATTIYCVARVVIGTSQRRPVEHDVDGVHALMGISMAGMLVTGLRILPAGIWAAVFGASGAWFAWRIARTYRAPAAGSGPATAYRHHHLPHLVMCGAMVYMLLGGSAAMAAATGGSMQMGGGAMGGTSHFTVLALALTIVLGGYAVWETDRVSDLPRVRALGPSPQRVEAALAVARAGVATNDYGVSGALASDDSEKSGDGRAAAATNPPVSPRLAACCQIAMAAAMAYMLVLML